MVRLRKYSIEFSLEVHTGGPRMNPGQTRDLALTAAGPLVALVGAVQEAITALREQEAGLSVLTPELPAHAGQGTVCG